MKKITYALGLMLLFATVAFCQPKILLDKTEINWGDVYSGTKLNGTITLKNEGKDTLFINSIYATCACTTVKEPKKFLLHQQSDEITIELNTSGMRGNVIKYLQINTNDPDSPMAVVKLSLNVIEELEPTSKMNVLVFGNIEPGSSLTKQMSYKNISNHTIGIKKIRTSSPSISVITDKEIIQPNAILHIEVTVNATQEGRWSEWVILETDSKGQSQVEFDIHYMSIQDSEE
ncbi:MAG: DUF1573 domain-containing protein [Bacteroidetes bacterium]|nr:DUF1573 domain-containing protein [Bacteroidota bacterium]